MRKRLLFLLVGVLTISAPCFAQTPPPMPATPSDDDLIKLALSAAPPAVAKNATVVFIDHQGKSRVLR